MSLNSITNEKPVLCIGIAGASSSGKTQLRSYLCKQFSDHISETMDMDGYHCHTREERNKLLEYPEDIKANNFEDLIRDIQLLKDGQMIKMPTYDHAKGSFGESEIISPEKVIFIEGLHAGRINEIAKQTLLDFSIFTYPDENLRKSWKVKRDVTERGYTYFEAIKQITEREIHLNTHIFPQMYSAEIIYTTNLGGNGKLENNTLFSPEFLDKLESTLPIEIINCFSRVETIFYKREFHKIKIDRNKDLTEYTKQAVREKILNPESLLVQDYSESFNWQSRNALALVILFCIKQGSTIR